MLGDGRWGLGGGKYTMLGDGGKDIMDDYALFKN